MSYIHNTIHCVMVLLLITLSYFYLELKDSLNAFESNAIKERDFSQLLVSKTNSHQFIQSSNVDIFIDIFTDGSQYGTKESGKILLSISESQFESGQLAIETAKQPFISETPMMVESDVFKINQLEGASTTSIVASVLLDQVMSTSQISLEHLIEPTISLPTEHSGISSTNNEFIIKKHITQNSFKKDFSPINLKYSEIEKTETIIYQPDVVVINTNFSTQLQFVSQTSKVQVSLRQIDSHVMHVTDNFATSESNTNAEPLQLAVSSLMTSEQKELHCLSQKCEALNGAVLKDVETLHHVEEENAHFTLYNPLQDIEVKGNVKADIEHLNIEEVADDHVKNYLISHGTSAFCEDKTKLCHFHNLCYKKNEQDFIFLHGNKSVVTGINYTEMFTINLSAVPGHNAHRLSLVSIPAESLSLFSTAIVDQTTFIMSRFKPDNIMHVLHDDILPLFETLYSLHLQHFNKKPKASLIFTDNFNLGEFIDVYTSLSSAHPILLLQLNTSVDIICFTDTYIGLSASTLWYQYGFFKPQGPLIINNTHVLLKVRRATEYLAQHFQKDCLLCKNQNHLVLISRKDNRLILNEGELAMSIARATKLKVMSVSLELQSLSEIISIVRSSKGIIGMHGSLLSLAMFLQPRSVVVELFPYGINPSKYSPFKTFCQLPGAGIVYTSWVNPHLHKSVGHPDWPSEIGGIQHLPAHIQEKILNESEVQDHLCCNDPSWLYHIYQDTHVDTDAVASLTSTSIALAGTVQLNAQPLTLTIPYLPGPVQNISCSHMINNDISGYLIAWSLPWNLDFIPYKLFESQLVYQDKTRTETEQVNIDMNSVSYVIKTSEANSTSEYNIWVRVVVDHNSTGPYSYFACNR
ncbi:protein O-linked-mannose beta-1,4-N-acetylglucosaminyltransferase 2-like [Biomphalaria glabrata]|uniref:Protein O-linked-mannose beta-1,4-N-acetylglucosaminyltransferase 2-like n=1 Tax=Biomphalaria glabrata TaxID=6526 RepID=A0A9W3B091_BIOGL|nr:protein O-linked-mannose beta-1,4-N-acetylglucosaminyltransferase 2-like [Biomphalaria glabrata]XP_055892892.1 protein O-linked-mannose beta-1,4-N-acetylglucosaminyltransferase 2-like [Biomphalaria glabrata]XP_055892893.1 protein O-linked-mannose beta-1,4-N-acetylglucosaminyltransferase 2-like [Biomphalaria glabrata]XP_055892894.1 protein O-linked-mannose beta-1,4-N-acetylglucosaminyltransferase 2-like [Biomphalaria glabrata]XP_055892895.1 protein O-linked-mannose beta-1,4-N-acetylglucosamin